MPNRIQEFVTSAISKPIEGTVTPSEANAVSGDVSLTAGIAEAGPFIPQLGRPIWLNLSGTFTGTCQLLRSTDGGETKFPLTTGNGVAKPIWTTPLNAAVAEDSVATASYWLMIEIASGSLSYKMEQ